MNHEHIIGDGTVELDTLHFVFCEVGADRHFKPLAEAHWHQDAIDFGELADGRAESVALIGNHIFVDAGSSRLDVVISSVAFGIGEAKAAQLLLVGNC